MKDLVIGNKLTCKKNYNNIAYCNMRYYSEEDYVKNNILEKNNEYIVEQCYDEIYFRINGHLFIILEHKDIKTPYLWNFFYTTEELREKKIKSL